MAALLATAVAYLAIGFFVARDEEALVLRPSGIAGQAKLTWRVLLTGLLWPRTYRAIIKDHWDDHFLY